MPNAAIVAAALTNHAARSRALYVNGVDVIKEPATPIRYAVPIETVLIEEQGPDGVSSMEFTVECSAPSLVNIGEGMVVRFEDITNSTTDFLGWVDHVDISEKSDNIGVLLTVRCTGVESALDWAMLPNDVTIAAGTAAETAVLALVGQAIDGSGGLLRAFASSTGSSTVAGPIANGMGSLSNAVTVTAGTTLREGIREVTGQVPADPLAGIPGAPNAFEIIYATVDFRGGLRYYSFSYINDNATLTVDADPPLTAIQAANITYGIDAAQYRAVVVKGTGVTVTVGDGSGKAGPTALLSDSAITTSAAAIAAGTAYLTQYGSDVRGQLDLIDSANPSSPALHAFAAYTIIADARLGLTNPASQFIVKTIARSFNPSQRSDWKVSFGGASPSVTALTRQLTRTTLS